MALRLNKFVRLSLQSFGLFAACGILVLIVDSIVSYESSALIWENWNHDERIEYGATRHFLSKETSHRIRAGKENIAIVSILSKDSNLTMYKTALDSMKCYALQNNYSFLLLSGADFETICEHKDITFQRHCIVSNILESNNFTWVLFVDSDIGVVNEKIRLENYIIKDAHIIFYERFFSFEIMAGSYFAKKSVFSMEFLRGWADYEFRLPKSFHGRDNGALHMYLMEILVPHAPLTPLCWKLWRDSVSWKTLKRFTLCCREALKNGTSSQIVAYKKGEGWARDSWLTNSHWSPQRDFMFHARKEKFKRRFVPKQRGNLKAVSFWGPWFDTISTPLDLDKCRAGYGFLSQCDPLLDEDATCVPKKFDCTIQIPFCVCNRMRKLGLNLDLTIKILAVILISAE